MNNLLTQSNELPLFSRITADMVQPAIEKIIDDNRDQIKGLLEGNQKPSWDSLVAPLDDLNDRLSKAWSPVSHMKSVVNSDELRDAYNACLPMLSDYSTELGQSAELCQAFKEFAASEAYTMLSVAQRKQIDNSLRDFHLAGVDLPTAEKQRYAEIQKRLSELSSKFSENVLDATQAWTKLIESENDISGLPDSALASMQQAAEAKGQNGYLITLEMPSYIPVMTYCENVALRQEMQHAYTSRASDCGPNAGTWDNSSLIDETLALRHELAVLLGFENYAAYSLATKMAETPEQVIQFLDDLAAKVKPLAAKEYAELEAFAHEQFNVAQLHPWDIAFYSEKLRQHRFAISQEELKPYFPAGHVIDGLFETANRLFAIDIDLVEGQESWHPDVHFYQISRQGQVIGQFYMDIYARENKQGGAWMGECRVRRTLPDASMQLPVAYLTCNFTAPVGDDPALLTHDEVTTLFHEFGHGLHHMLTQVDVMGVSGINGVPWDAVELPSQFLENWCWQAEGIELISSHYETGEQLPDKLLQKMLAAKNFQSAMQTVRQLEFSLFDFRLHLEYNPESPQAVQALIDEVRDRVSVIPVSSENRFQNGFSHIFAGGYAAGYYSYKWAEVLSADAFSRFQEEGVFNQQTGESFLHNILEKGGSEEPMQLFVAFRGREPQVEALLRQDGLIE